MNVKKLIATTILATSLMACNRVPVGHQGIIVDLYGEDKGVSQEHVGVGMYWVGFFKDLYLFPTFLQNHTWHDDEKITIQTSEGLSINTDVGITYSIQPDNVVKVFQKYRRGIEEITDVFLRNMVRDAMNQVSSTMKVHEIYGDKKEEFLNRINQIVKKGAVETGIDVDKIYLIGSLELPSTVIDSINMKIQATQNALRVENEIQTATAEAEKVIIKAKAEAEANTIIAQSLTKEFISYQAQAKWDGKLPQITGNATPFVHIEGK